MAIVRCSLLPIAALIVWASLAHASQYTFTVTRKNQIVPAISSQYAEGKNGGSVFTYNYNAAFAPLNQSSDPSVTGGLFVRCQNATNEPYGVHPSVIAFVKRHTPGNELNHVVFEPISDSNIVIQPNGPNSSFGCEDPRAVYNPMDETYYILYSSVANTTGGIPISRLALATTMDPTDPDSYTLHGPIFPDIKWSKSGALLIREEGPSYLYWGDSSIVPGIQMATTPDLLHYTNNPGIFIPIRPNNFDSMLVEAGPMPLPLSDGNYLFLYNSGRHGYPSPKPNWDVQYNVGWVILDGQDPSNILQRCEEPILSPETAWEIGKAPYLGLTPNVVFVEGWYPVDSKNDTFVIFYGAADSVIGVAELTVTITN